MNDDRIREGSDTWVLDRLAAMDQPAAVKIGGTEAQLVPMRSIPMPADPGRRLSLNGNWQVARWPFAENEAALASRRTHDDGWETIRQPGKVFYRDPEDDPSANPDWNRATLAHIDPDDGAMLRHEVTVPAEWKGKRVFLLFGAVYPAARIYVNGSLVGDHPFGLIPFCGDVTDRVQAGATALVAVRLLRRHPLVRLDMPRHAMEFTGISQDSWLVAVEQVHAADIQVTARPDGACRRGLLKGSVELVNRGAVPRTVRVTVTIMDRHEGRVQYGTGACAVQPGQRGRASFNISVPAVRPWSDEDPALYDVVVQLAVPQQASQTLRFRTGFRSLEVSGGRPRLNGKFIKFRGVNLLTFHPEHGMHMPPSWLKKNLELMKKANVNAIRTHFTAPPELAALCDEMGFYLLQEITIDWVSDLLGERRILGPILARVEGTVRRDRLHPSVVGWTIGNENLPPGPRTRDVYWSNVRLCHLLAKRLAPDRITMAPPPGPANKVKGLLETRIGDVADTHYNFNYIRDLNTKGRMLEPVHWGGEHVTVTRKQVLRRGWSGVWFSSEWGLVNAIPDLLNAPYASVIADRPEDPLCGRNTLQVFINRVAGEWQYMRDDPACLGGAFFPWMCAGSGDPWGWTQWGEDADWGVVTHDLQLKPFFWALRVIYSPVQFQPRAVWRKGEKTFRFKVLNLHHRRNLNECVLRTMMAGGGGFMGVMRRWKDYRFDCAPGESAEIEVPIWNDVTFEALKNGQPVVCRCIVLEPSGYRPITADVVVVPRSLTCKSSGPIVIGPDADLKDA
jgi:hypothetical protein